MGLAFINLPANASDGAVAWVDCSTMGAEREVVVAPVGLALVGCAPLLRPHSTSSPPKPI